MSELHLSEEEREARLKECAAISFETQKSINNAWYRVFSTSLNYLLFITFLITVILLCFFLKW
ncbi:MAG TPA: hypothetical protein EYQ50_09095 [Verrucomicrobiales bacterium]|jgi:hypothetical protein|nr:hypothetical protein [Verrucomicrobiales bacterium]HIL69674.1 hypothetical protein [Verrucomicrobiota bacterium]